MGLGVWLTLSWIFLLAYGLGTVAHAVVKIVAMAI
jgi:hypothetical protein